MNLKGTVASKGAVNGTMAHNIGADGRSAYQVALDNGFEGTEKEWLESLKGEKGKQGEKGEKGDAGSIAFKVVAELPTENISESTIYLVPIVNEDEQNNYLEYIYVDGHWEYIGSATVEVDLEDFVKKDDYANANKAGVVQLSNYGAYGLYMTGSDSNVIAILKATNAEIDGRNNSFKPIVPFTLDYSVMKSLTDPKKHTWTDEEKAKALELLGGVQQFDGSKETGDLRFTVYGQSMGVEIQRPVSRNPIEGALVQYESGGNVNVAEPRMEGHATTKKYVDDLVGSKNIITSASGEVVAITDSAKVRPKNIKLYGKCTQNGTPSMTNEVAVKSLGESGSIGGKVLVKNILPPHNVNVYIGVTNQWWDCVRLSFAFKKGNTYTISFDAPHDNCKFYVSANGIFDYLDFIGNGQRVSITKTFTEDTLFENAPLISLLESSELGNGEFTNFQIELNDYATEYVPYTEQPFTSHTPNGLRGIPLGTTIPDAIKNSPIHMSGVYHDGEQYWIGDTKNEDGKDVQRIWKGNPNKQLVFTSRDNNGRCSVFGNGIFDVMLMNADIPSMSSVAIWSAWGNRDDGTFALHQNGLYYKDSTKTLDEINAEFSKLGTDIEFAGILAEPIITDTSEQYDVVMNYPNTTIVNDAWAYMEVEYVADTKNYVDGKNGADGHTPVKGIDYFTKADKEEMVSSVIEALPKYNGEVISE